MLMGMEGYSQGSSQGWVDVPGEGWMLTVWKDAHREGEMDVHEEG